VTVGVAGEEWDSHLLLLYRQEADRRDNVALWIQRGLDRDEKILFSQVPGDTTLLGGLRQRGMDVSSAVRRGQFSVLSLEEFYPAVGQASLVDGALAEGYAGVRLAAHANAALAYLDRQGYGVADRLLEELCRMLPVSALCQCDSGHITAESLGVVIDNHPAALLDSQARLRRQGDLIVASGEIDLSSAATVARWLSGACRPERGLEVVIDLSRLQFLDAAGCRALITGTAAFRGAGGAVFLRRVPGHISKVMRLCEVDRIAGVNWG
jgi:anti-anti-sigma factor